MLRIDPGDAIPIWKQIEEGVRRLVASGALPAGGPVPSVRDLARDLGCSRNLVLLAYEQLVLEGYLVARQGGGTYVSPELPVRTPQTKADPVETPSAVRLSRRGRLAVEVEKAKVRGKKIWR